MFPHLEESSLMTKAEIDILWDFARRTGARSLHVNIWLGTVGYGAFGPCAADEGSAFSFTAATPVGVSGINLGSAKLNYAGIYRCPATGFPSGQCALYNVPAINGVAGTSGSIITNCSVQPIVIQDSDGGVVASLTTYEDGRETMSFMHGCAAWSSSCLLLGHMALAWLTQNIIPGERTVLLSVQTDDVFLSTFQDDTNDYFRTSPADLNAHIAWQDSLRPPNSIRGIRLPPGSSITIDFPFNGNGILGATGKELEVADGSCSASDEYVDLGCSCFLLTRAACPMSQPEFCRNCTKDWAKPAGFGTDKFPNPLPANYSADSWPARISQDPLAAAVLADAGGVATKFFYSHHTFTHQILDNATLYDANLQLSLNKQMADKLGLTPRTAVFSSQCMVTPGISGLVNGDALQGLWQNGLQCATGDNTWAHLKNPDNVHQMLYTTQATNGFANFAILPRWAAEIYFNCSTVAQNERLYHAIYPFIADYSMAAILSRESNRVLANLLALRKDPHMMHQANLRVEADGMSLVMRWVEAVLRKLTACVTWPVQSLKLDDLQQQFKLREQRDNCKLAYRLAVSTATNKVTGVAVTSQPGATSGCSAPLTVGAGAAVSGGAVDATDAAAPVYRVALGAGGTATLGANLDWKPTR